MNTNTDEIIEAIYDVGCTARKEGKKLTDNPYLKQCKPLERRSWDRGYVGAAISDNGDSNTAA